MNQETRQCQNCEKDFVIEPEDFDFYEKMKVPAPTWCPDCRLQRRLSFKNERVLYKRICDSCKKSMISIFPEKTKFPVYCPKCWYADSWGAEEYGIPYDSTKDFFTQFRNLVDRVPRSGLYIDPTRTINSEYVHLTGPLKDCYLVFLGEQDENCMYSYSIFYSKDLVDCTKVLNTTQGYELISCESCYHTFFSTDCRNCIDVLFSKNCINCTNCFGCVNLSNKKFCFFNEELSEEEYRRRVDELFSGSFRGIQKAKQKSSEFFKGFPVRYMHGAMNDVASGDYLFQCKNVKKSFQVIGGTNNKYCQTLNMAPTADSYDYSDWGNNASLVYEAVNCGELSNIKFCYGAWLGGDYEYCDMCIDLNNCFGCVSLRKKQYCILNKEYSKEEYEKLRKEILANMQKNLYKDKKGRVYTYGEFFPMELSPYPYKDTVAFEYFPLSDEKIRENGFHESADEERSYPVTIQADNLPDNIHEVSDAILKEIIGCAHAGTACGDRCANAFKITPQELQFYRQMNLPLPRLCYNCRHYQRFHLMNPFKLWHRVCMCDKPGHNHVGKCTNKFETSYAPERPEIVYCEECYQKEVF